MGLVIAVIIGALLGGALAAEVSVDAVSRTAKRVDWWARTHKGVPRGR